MGVFFSPNQLHAHGNALHKKKNAYHRDHCACRPNGPLPQSHLCTTPMVMPTLCRPPVAMTKPML
jgi:hypothetical protein